MPIFHYFTSTSAPWKNGSAGLSRLEEEAGKVEGFVWVFAFEFFMNRYN
jgi:hypothetical protein